MWFSISDTVTYISNMIHNNNIQAQFTLEEEKIALIDIDSVPNLLTAKFYIRLMAGLLTTTCCMFYQKILYQIK